MKTHDGLPVHGYRPQSDHTVRLINLSKEREERFLRWLDALRNHGGYDQRWLEEARTHVEIAFMALNRAVFQPERIALPEDDT